MLGQLLSLLPVSSPNFEESRLLNKKSAIEMLITIDIHIENSINETKMCQCTTINLLLNIKRRVYNNLSQSVLSLT